MSIGAGIALLVIGAILAFAVNVQLDYLDLHLIGYILMAAGAAVFIIGLILIIRGRRTESITTATPDGQRTVNRTDDLPYS